MKFNTAMLLITMLIACGKSQSEPKPPTQVHAVVGESLAGTVVDPAGEPVAGANVCLYDMQVLGTTAMTSTDVNGNYQFTQPPGRYAVAAVAEGFTAVMSKPFAHGEGMDTSRGAVRTETLKLTRGGGTIRGQMIRDQPGRAALPWVTLEPRSGRWANVCVVPNSEGRFAVQVPADRYYLALGANDTDWFTVHTAYEVMKGETTNVKQAVYRRADLREVASKEVMDRLQAIAVPIKTAIAGSGFDDLSKLDHLVASARVVGLGEATHGNREFFQFKHRMLEYLVERHGFSVFAIEGIFSEGTAVNDYIVHGRGNAASALASMYFWVWDTEEVIALIEWMRSYNEDPSHPTKLRFYGVDMQFTPAAAAAVRGYLARVESPLARSSSAQWKAWSDKYWTVNYHYKRTAATEAPVREMLGAIVSEFESSRDAMIAKTSTAEYRLARQHLRILEQAELAFRPSNGDIDTRDQSMADNTMWILEEDPAVKVVLWAHNRHIQEVSVGYQFQGTHLRERLGEKFVTFGFSFNQGSFQARDSLKGPNTGVTEVKVGPAPTGNIEHTYSRLGHSIAAIDLRAAAADPILATYYSVPRLMRETGSGWSAEESRTAGHSHLTDFDAMIFFERTTRARPTPTGIRRPGE